MVGEGEGEGGRRAKRTTTTAPMSMAPGCVHFSEKWLIYS